MFVAAAVFVLTPAAGVDVGRLGTQRPDGGLLTRDVLERIPQSKKRDVLVRDLVDEPVVEVRRLQLLLSISGEFGHVESECG